MSSRSGSQRILVLTSSYPRAEGDSAGHFVHTEVCALREAGHDVTVWAAGVGQDEPGLTFLGGAALFDHPGAWARLKSNPLRVAEVFRVRQRIKERASEDRFDRIIAHWLVPGALPWALTLPQHLPLEVVCHGSDVRLFVHLPTGVRVKYLRKLRDRGAHLRFVSSELREHLSRATPQELWSFLAASTIEPSPIDCGPALSQRAARRHLSLDEGARWAVIVARLIESKRVDVALRAALLIPQLEVAVIGSGPLELSLKESFPEARFLGQLPRPETLRWIRAADVLVATSRKEGAPTVIREARTVGTSVVSAPSGDTRLWAQKDRDLWLVD